MKKFKNKILVLLVIAAFNSCGLFSKDDKKETPPASDVITEIILLKGQFTDTQGMPLVSAQVSVNINYLTVARIRSNIDSAPIQVVPTLTIEQSKQLRQKKSRFKNFLKKNKYVNATRSQVRAEGIYTATTDENGNYTLELPKALVTPETGKKIKIPLKVVSKDGTDLGTVTLTMDENNELSDTLEYDETALKNIIAFLPTIVIIQASTVIKYTGYYVGRGNTGALNPKHFSYKNFGMYSYSSGENVILNFIFYSTIGFDLTKLADKANYIITDNAGNTLDLSSISIGAMVFSNEYYDFKLTISDTQTGSLYKVALSDNLTDNSGTKPKNWDSSLFSGNDGITSLYNTPADYSASGNDEINIYLDSDFIASQTNKIISCADLTAIQDPSNYELSKGTVSSVTVSGCTEGEVPSSITLILDSAIVQGDDSERVNIKINNIFKNSSSDYVTIQKSFWAYDYSSGSSSTEFKASAYVSDPQMIKLRFTESALVSTLTTLNITLVDQDGNAIAFTVDTYYGSVSSSSAYLTLTNNLDNTKKYTLTLNNVQNSDSTKTISNQIIEVVDTSFEVGGIVIIDNYAYISFEPFSSFVGIDQENTNATLKFIHMPSMAESGTVSGSTSFEPVKNSFRYDPATKTTTYFEAGMYDTWEIQNNWETLTSVTDQNSSKFFMVVADISTLSLNRKNFYFVDVTGVKDKNGQEPHKWVQSINLFFSEPLKSIQSATLNGTIDLLNTNEYNFDIGEGVDLPFGIVGLMDNNYYKPLSSGEYNFDLKGITSAIGDKTMDLNQTITVP